MPAGLTTHPAFDGFPTFSADGTKIAFASNRSGSGDIYVINADRSALRRLTRNPAVDGEPAFLQDGGIAFRSKRSGGGDIYLIEGSAQTRLTTNSALDTSPDSP